MSTEELDDFFERESDKFKISNKIKTKIISKLQANDLKFEISHINNSETELNFETYQILIYENQISISLPYWDENSSDKINHEIEVIIDILEEFDMTGYDPQCESIISGDFNFQDIYSNNYEQVSTILENYDEEINPKRKRIIVVVGLTIIGLAIFGLIQLIKIIFN